ncbi:hypothetical protein WMF30_01285 [Sorangium sp. So ce134]
MSRPKDPPRLFDASSDTTDAVRGVLRAGRRELPGPSDLARLAARLPLGPLPPPGASPPGASPPGASLPGASPPAGAPQVASPPPPPPLAPGHLTAAAAGPSVASSALLGALLGLGVVGGVWWRDAATAPRDAAPSALASAAGPSAAAPAPTPPPPAEPGPDGVGHAGSAAAAADRGAAHEPSSATAPHDELLPRASTAATRAGEAAIPSPGAPGGGAPPSARPPSAGAAEVAETEVQLLHRAQDALATDAGSALALTVEHARRFPAGALGQEREIIAIRALLALGRAAEARARAAGLLERFPGSAYRGRLESLGLEEPSSKN